MLASTDVSTTCEVNILLTNLLRSSRIESHYWFVYTKKFIWPSVSAVLSTLVSILADSFGINSTGPHSYNRYRCWPQSGTRMGNDNRHWAAVYSLS